MQVDIELTSCNDTNTQQPKDSECFYFLKKYDQRYISTVHVENSTFDSSNGTSNIQSATIAPLSYEVGYRDPIVMSCGVIILDTIGRIFLAHATATPHWDIPKGHPNYGEAPLDASLRELTEETGIVLSPKRLVDLGCFTYRPNKDLHLFAVRIFQNEIDITRCVCTSLFFSERTRTVIPEMDLFRWSKPEEVDSLVSYSLARLFRTQLLLTNLHQWL